MTIRPDCRLARSHMIEVRGVTARDGQTTLRDVSLQIERGTLCVVLGPSGAGKSALLRLLAGSVVPARGSVFVDGAAPVARRIESVRSCEIDVDRTIRRNPDLLLVDEPATSAPREQPFRSLHEIHRLTASGVTVVAVLRDIDAAAYFADRVALVRHGRIVAHGEPDVVLQPLLLAHVFGFRCALRRVATRPSHGTNPFGLGGFRVRPA